MSEKTTMTPRRPPIRVKTNQVGRLFLREIVGDWGNVDGQLLLIGFDGSGQTNAVGDLLHGGLESGGGQDGSIFVAQAGELPRARVVCGEKIQRGCVVRACARHTQFHSSVRMLEISNGGGEVQRKARISPSVF